MWNNHEKNSWKSEQENTYYPCNEKRLYGITSNLNHVTFHKKRKKSYKTLGQRPRDIKHTYNDKMFLGNVYIFLKLMQSCDSRWKNFQLKELTVHTYLVSVFDIFTLQAHHFDAGFAYVLFACVGSRLWLLYFSFLEKPFTAHT